MDHLRVKEWCSCLKHKQGLWSSGSHWAHVETQQHAKEQVSTCDLQNQVQASAPAPFLGKMPWKCLSLLCTALRCHMVMILITYLVSCTWDNVGKNVWQLQRPYRHVPLLSARIVVTALTCTWLSPALLETVVKKSLHPFVFQEMAYYKDPLFPLPHR